MTDRRFPARACAVLAALSVAVLAAGCTSVAPYRPALKDPVLQHVQPPCERHARTAGGDWDEVSLAEQRRTERLDCYAESVEHTAQYKLFFVEFDEQGRFYDREQMEQLVRYLQRMRDTSRKSAAGTETKRCANGGGGLSIVTFVHGWRHNARHDDSNVALAREVLRYTYGGESTEPHNNPADCPRQVVGVYVGWRGLSTTATDAAAGPVRWALAWWELLSVWDRKNTAQNVAVGSVRELFGTIRAYQELRNEEEGGACSARAPTQEAIDAHTRERDALRVLDVPGKAEQIQALQKRIDDMVQARRRALQLEAVYQCLAVRHLIVGHSYGALIVHNAVAQQLLENVTRGRFETPRPLTVATLDRAAQQPMAPRAGPQSVVAAGGPPQAPLQEDHPCLPGPTGRTGGKSLVRGYADLIVLLNPAVEGARYEPLYEAVAQRTRANPGEMGAFCDNQKPVMVVLTSEGDDATLKLFPFVRVFTTLFESNHPYAHPSEAARAYIATEEQRSSLKTMGHNERYNTHELRGWETYLTLPAADEVAAAKEKRAEKDRQDAAALWREPPRPAGVAENFRKMHTLRDQARAIRREHADDVIGPRCRGPQPMRPQDRGLCMPAQSRSSVQAERVSERERCARGAEVDRNLADALRPVSATRGYGVAGWSMAFFGGSVLSHLPYYLPDYNPSAHEELVGQGKNPLLPEIHSPHSPIWNIMVRDKSIMDDHGEIEGQAMVLLLAQLYRAVVLSSFSPLVVDQLRDIGTWPSPCDRLAPP